MNLSRFVVALLIMAGECLLMAASMAATHTSTTTGFWVLPMAAIATLASLYFVRP